MRSLAVFCASSPGNHPRWVDSARAFGALLAQRRIGIVYGGGRVGLMGAVADGALAAGGEVIGVIPRAMVEAERAHAGVTKLHIVTTMHERKAMMADLADGFVALPGGYGTLDELFEIITWAQLALHTKPVGLLNQAGFYDGLLAFLDHVVACGFIQPRFRSLVFSHADPAALLASMAEHRPVPGGGFAREDVR
jgi:hypothetical protein